MSGRAVPPQIGLFSKATFTKRLAEQASGDRAYVGGEAVLVGDVAPGEAGVWLCEEWLHASGVVVHEGHITLDEPIAEVYAAYVRAVLRSGMGGYSGPERGR